MAEDVLQKASSFLGASGHLSHLESPIIRAEANRQGAKNALTSKPEFRLATPQQQEAVLAETDAREWLPAVEAAEAAARETIENAKAWLPELETFATSEPVPSATDLARAALLKPFVEEDVADLRLPDEAARLVDAARVERDTGRLFAVVRAVHRRQRAEHDKGGIGFTSPALKTALDKALFVLREPGAPARERARALITELQESIAKARERVDAVRKEERHQEAVKVARASGLYNHF